MISQADAKSIAALLAAVGEPTRMLLLHRLTDGPSHVGALAELVGAPVVNVSHHLGVMRQAGILDDTRAGRRKVYALRDDVYTPGGGAGILGTLRKGGFSLVLRTEEAAAKARAKMAG
jgi:DNA-binding transcriptional ArsR family regulator